MKHFFVSYSMREQSTLPSIKISFVIFLCALLSLTLLKIFTMSSDTLVCYANASFNANNVNLKTKDRTIHTKIYMVLMRIDQPYLYS